MATPIKLSQINGPLSCEDYDNNIDAVLDRANHTGVQSCTTIDQASLATCVSQTPKIIELDQASSTLKSRIEIVENAIANNGSISQDLQSLKGDLLARIDDVQVISNSHGDKIRDLELDVSGLDSAIININSNLDYEVDQLQDQVTSNLQLIGTVNTNIGNNTRSINTVKEDLGVEATTRSNGDNAVAQSVSDEASFRISSDEQLQRNINDEVNYRISSINAVNNRITDEVRDLGGAIENEARVRTLSDEALQVQINTLNSSINSVIPTGSILMWAGKNIPPGFLLCNGQTVSRATYPALFAAIGTSHGESSSTEFRTPNFSDRFPLGDPAATYSSQAATYGGNNEIELEINNLPSHRHRQDFSRLSHHHTVRAEHDHNLNIRFHGHNGGPFASHSHGLKVKDQIGLPDPQGFSYRILVDKARDLPFEFTPHTDPAASGVPNVISYSRIFPEGADPSINKTNIDSTIYDTDTHNPGSGGLTDPTGSGSPINIRPSHLTVKFIIKT